MAFNIDQFNSTLGQQEGLMRTNRFEVRFPMPELLINSVQDARICSFMCESVAHPGYLLATHDVRRWTYGPVEKRPWSPQFSQLQITFNNTNRNGPWKLFNDWMQAIMGHQTEFGIQSAAGDGLVYEVEYKTKYASNIELIIYDATGHIKKSLIFREVFPSQMPDVGLAWGDMNSPFKFQVIFDYLDWFNADFRNIVVNGV